MIYLQVGFSIGVFQKEQIFSVSAQERRKILIEYYPNFSELVVGFIQDQMRLKFDDLVHCILDLVKYFAMSSPTNMPMAAKRREKVVSRVLTF